MRQRKKGFVLNELVRNNSNALVEMARSKPYGLVGLVVVFVGVVTLLYFLKAMFPQYYDGFRDVNCYGVKCAEGQFCQDNVCRNINPPYTNNYFNEGFQTQGNGMTCPPGTMMSNVNGQTNCVPSA